MDTGPYMINLSLAYGCPVISFNIGVAVELVTNAVTGFKASEISADELAHAIGQFIDFETKGIHLNENCLKLAKEDLSWTGSSLAIFDLE